MSTLRTDPDADYDKGDFPFIAYRPERRGADEVLRRAKGFYEELDARRSVRMFSPDPVPREAIEYAIRTASTAPSGAHQQPWTWVIVGDAETKHKMRVAAEEEERTNYEGGRMSEEWQGALKPLGTNSSKPYMDIVPWIVVAFEQIHGYNEDGSIKKHYYAKQSTGIACGMFISALHVMGLATLTHTPSPMAFLSKLLERPSNEKPFAVFPVGYPADNCIVPDISRKTLAQITAAPPHP